MHKSSTQDFSKNLVINPENSWVDVLRIHDCVSIIVTIIKKNNHKFLLKTLSDHNYADNNYIESNPLFDASQNLVKKETEIWNLNKYPKPVSNPFNISSQIPSSQVYQTLNATEDNNVIS